jgi:hypothetical protein
VPSSPLAAFAETNGLVYAPTAELPARGRTLAEPSGRVEGAASGTLPGGIEGTLARFTYVYKTTDSDNNTREENRPFTLVVTEIPESIGFLPFLGFCGRASQIDPRAGGEDMVTIDMEKSEALKGARAYAYRGTNEHWLAQLLSPALVQWLERCPDDFGFELASGVLCAGRGGYIGNAVELKTLCADAAHLAGAIREEAMEEVGTGGEEESAARDPNAVDPQMEAALAAVSLDPPPPNRIAALGAFKGYARRAPATISGALRFAIALTLVLNVPGIALPIVLLSAGAYVALAAIEVAVIAIIFAFSYRSRINKSAAKYAEEAFYRGYAGERTLTLEEPLRFVATHAEAKLPFKPDRVLSGPLPTGANGALAVAGDGSKRADRVAVVAGPRGPVAEAELHAEAPALSSQTLDGYRERLAKEVAEDLATRPA